MKMVSKSQMCWVSSWRSTCSTALLIFKMDLIHTGALAPSDTTLTCPENIWDQTNEALQQYSRSRLGTSASPLVNILFQ